MKRSAGEAAFSVVNATLLVLISLTIILPFMHIFSVSVSNETAVTNMEVGIWPIGFNGSAYIEVVQKTLFQSSLLNSVFLTVIYTVLGLFVNTLAAYGFSKPFCGKRVVTYIFVVTMYFGGGLIPTYMLITNTLHLYNNFLAYILPALVSVFYIIVIRSQIEALPPSLAEAAEIDGANEFQLLFHIVLPSIKSTLAAISMFLALGMWNMWYSVLLYTNKDNMWTLQYFLRSVVFDKLLENRYNTTQTTNALAVDATNISPYNFQMAAIITVAAPIVCIYPFVQKYFVKGILVGSIKE